MELIECPTPGNVSAGSADIVSICAHLRNGQKISLHHFSLMSQGTFFRKYALLKQTNSCFTRICQIQRFR